MRRVTDGERARTHNPAFDYVVKKAIKVVRDAAKQKHSSVAYCVPDYVQGFPIYSKDACMRYVVSLFERKGYDVRRATEDIIVVRWEDDPSSAGVPQVPQADSGRDAGVDDVFSRLSL